MSAPDPAPLRRAEAADAGALAGLCREAFPRSFRWRSVGFAWWRQALADPAAETWLISGPEGLAGFTLLITDEAAWARSASTRDGPAWRRALVALASPATVLRRLLPGAPALPPGPPAPGLRPAARVFVELFAVARAARGQGVARRLVRHGRQRAADLGRAGCCYRVSSRNAPMLALLRTEGFGVSAVRRGGCYLSRAG